MKQSDTNTARGAGLTRSLATAMLAVAAATSLVLPSVAYADPVPPPPSPAPAAPPAGPNVPPPPPADPNAPPAPPADPNVPPPPPADPNAPPADPNVPPPPPAEPGRVNNAAGGLSYVVPAGWKVSDATQLSYGQALLTRIPPQGVTQPPSDTSILLGRLDGKLYAGSEADNAKAAPRLASDMGEFFMPYAGTRINQGSAPLDANGMTGVASFYDVKFTDTTKPNGQIWAGVVGAPTAPGTPRGQRAPERWFVVWLGSANNPVDKAAATTLANSIRPWSAPPPPPPDPNAPPPVESNVTAGPNAPAQRPEIGVPVPVQNVPPEMMPAG